MKNKETSIVMDVSLAIGDDEIGLEEHDNRWRIVADFTEWKVAQTVFNAILKFMKEREKQLDKDKQS